MAQFASIQATPEGSGIRLRFKLGTPGTIGWQVFDPTSGAFLFEGEWIESHANNIDLRLNLPADDGPYRVQVAPVEDRERFILIDARVTNGSVEMTSPRVASSDCRRTRAPGHVCAEGSER